MLIKLYHKYSSFLNESINLHIMSNAQNELEVVCKAGSLKHHQHWISNYVWVK